VLEGHLGTTAKTRIAMIDENIACVKFTEVDHCAFVVQGNSYFQEQLVLK
jgi:hypothetical protein